MALQGTLETFSVPEVLRLLAGTTKTGLLTLDGDRGSGKVWVNDGRIVAASSDHEQGDRVGAVLFDLLRYETGSFVFDSGTLPDAETDVDVEVDDVLIEAERLLEEWREIAAVVPSLDVHVRLVEDLDTESVTITAAQWRSVALVGSGISARHLGAHLGVGEFDGCSAVRDLVVAGLAEISELDEVPAASDADADAWTAPEPAPVTDHDLSHDEVATLGADLAGFVAQPTDDPADLELDEFDDADAGAGAAIDAGAHEPPTFQAETETEPVVEAHTDAGEAGEAGEPDEFLSQLANLSPRAAAAIEATADDPTELDDQIAAAADGDEEINRNLLLKFLSSAKN